MRERDGGGETESLCVGSLSEYIQLEFITEIMNSDMSLDILFCGIFRTIAGHFVCQRQRNESKHATARLNNAYT